MCSKDEYLIYIQISINLYNNYINLSIPRTRVVGLVERRDKNEHTYTHTRTHSLSHFLLTDICSSFSFFIILLFYFYSIFSLALSMSTAAITGSWSLEIRLTGYFWYGIQSLTKVF